MLSRHSAVVARKSGAHVVLPWLSVARVSGSWLFSVTSLLAQWSPVALPSSDWLPSGAAWSLAEHMWAHAPQNWGELLQIFPSASVLAAAVGPLRNWAGADATQMTWTGRALFLPLPKLGEVCGNVSAMFAHDVLQKKLQIVKAWSFERSRPRPTGDQLAAVTCHCMR